MEDVEQYIDDALDDTFGLESDSTVGSCSVYYLDVGQGDSALILTDSAAVLIDAGEASAGDTVLSALQEHGVKTLDYVIATHPPRRPHRRYAGSSAVCCQLR